MAEKSTDKRTRINTLETTMEDMNKRNIFVRIKVLNGHVYLHRAYGGMDVTKYALNLNAKFRYNPVKQCIIIKLEAPDIEVEDGSLLILDGKKGTLRKPTNEEIFWFSIYS